MPWTHFMDLLLHLITMITLLYISLLLRFKIVRETFKIERHEHFAHFQNIFGLTQGLVHCFTVSLSILSSTYSILGEKEG